MRKAPLYNGCCTACGKATDCECTLRDAFDAMNNPNPHKKKAEELGVPLIPPLPNKYQTIRTDTIAVCGQCGLEIKQIMGYVCSQSNCPVFLKVTC